MKRWIKRVSARMFPKTVARILAVRARRHNHSFVKQIGSLEVTRTLVGRFGPIVQTGPFAGMILTPATHMEHLGPYLLGTYESELHIIWERLLNQKFTQVIDVGAKFGYYAIGLAKVFPTSSILAFDTDPWARQTVVDMARANEVLNVTILGFCSPEWLDSNLKESALLISDCEGYESELFILPTHALRSATIVVETHDFIVHGVTDQLCQRFGGSHTLESIPSRSALAPPDIDLTFLSESSRDLALNEFRPRTHWLIFTPKDPA